MASLSQQCISLNAFSQMQSCATILQQNIFFFKFTVTAATSPWAFKFTTNFSGFQIFTWLLSSSSRAFYHSSQTDLNLFRFFFLQSRAGFFSCLLVLHELFQAFSESLALLFPKAVNLTNTCSPSTDSQVFQISLNILSLQVHHELLMALFTVPK